MMITSSTPARRMFATVLVAAAAALTGAFVASGPAGARPAGAPPPGSGYVALGDSYAAGYGIGTSTGRPVAGCAQSTQDYPHQIAAALKLRLTDVSCTGAVTANIDTTRQVTDAGTAALQDTALRKTTKLVTVTIGGNDLGFGDIAKYCLAVTASGPLVLHPTELNCKAHYAPAGGTDSLAERIANVVVPRVARVLAAIHTKAPNAKVYFIDYPAISTTQAGSPDPATYPDSCFSPVAVPNSFPFTGVDTVYLQAVQANLNAALSARVAKSGDAFVEAYPQSLPHSACAGTAQPWMNGVTFDLQTQSSAPGSLHPNLIGATKLAGAALAAIGPYSAPPAPPPTSSPARPATHTVHVVSATSRTLANSGPSNAGPLTLGGLLLVLAGSGLLLAARRRPESASRR